MQESFSRSCNCHQHWVSSRQQTFCIFLGLLIHLLLLLFHSVRGTCQVLISTGLSFQDWYHISCLGMTLLFVIYPVILFCHGHYQLNPPKLAAWQFAQDFVISQVKVSRRYRILNSKYFQNEMEISWISLHLLPERILTITVGIKKN